MNWTEKYIGLPYKELGRDKNGVDCYGLCKLIYKNELNIDLPDYIGIGVKRETTQELQKESNRQVQDYILKESEKWVEIPTSEAKEFDFVLFSIMGYVVHIAVLVDKNTIIHSFNGRDCVVEKIYPKWHGRIYKVIRWQK